MKNRLTLSPVALACCLLTPWAHAQTSALSALPPVTVSVTKTAQALSQTAASVTVLDAETITSRRIQTLEDLPSAVPNLQLNNSLGAGTLGYLTIRGLGNSPGSWDPSATVVVDDVPFNDFFGYQQALVDIERIEVLRGPQGTLYGGFAEAGVIDVRSRLPGLAFGGFVALEVASRGGVRASGAVSGPVAGPSLRLGAAVLTEEADSPNRDVALQRRGSHRAQAYRLQALWAPAPELEALLTVTEQRLRGTDGVQYLPVNPAQLNALLPAGQRVGDFETATDYDGLRKVDASGQSLRVNWRQPSYEVVAVAAHRSFDGPYAFDFDYTPLAAPSTPGFGVPVISDSSYRTRNDHAEVRAQSRGDGALVWLAGVAHSRQQVDLVSDGVFPAGFGMFVPAGGRVGFNDATGEGRNTAVFGQLTWRLDTLGLTAGLRRETAEREGVNRAVFFGTPAFDARVRSSRTLPKLGLDWRWSPQATAYANVASGWRPGGVNLYADTSTFGNRQPDPITYASQRTRTVEAGLNWRSPARDLEAQAAVFQTQVRGYQETILTGGVGTAYLANIPEVQIPGGELSLRWRASPAWMLNTALGVARARYERYGFAGNLLAGRELANRPDWTATFGARWQQGPWRLGADVNGSASFLSAYQSDGSSTRVEGHWVLNLQGAYQLGDWTFTAAVNNANNQRYLLNSHYVVAGRQVPVGMAGSPRTVSLQAKVAL